MNKQEVIRKAFNNVLQKVSYKYKKQVLDNIAEDGWCEMFDSDNNLISPSFKKLGFSYEFSERHIETKQLGDACYWRPKSLRGIEMNNSWTKIENEADLPKESGDYWTYEKNGSIGIRFFMSIAQTWGNHEMEVKEPNVTHYQPITKPLKPIY